MHTNMELELPPQSRLQLRAAGLLAFVIAVISAVGVVLLVAMFAAFSQPRVGNGMRFGRLNDICVAIQYALTIPLALLLNRLLAPYDPRRIPRVTRLGIVGMIAIVLLQVALVLERLTFERQVGWVTLAMFGAVGPWLVVTGLAARKTGRMPRSLTMSLLAVPYLGTPVWAFWLGRRLLAWSEAGSVTQSVTQGEEGR